MSNLHLSWSVVQCTGHCFSMGKHEPCGWQAAPTQFGGAGGPPHTRSSALQCRGHDMFFIIHISVLCGGMIGMPGS